MKRSTRFRSSIGLIAGIGLAMLVTLAGPATAQDGPSLTVDPATVDAVGEATFTVTGTGWTAEPPLFILPCTVPESGEPTDLSTDSCDTANLTPATPADGAFEVEVTFEIPEEGLIVAAGDAAQSESAVAMITVGAAEEPATAEEEEEEAAPATTEENAEESAEATEETEETELAQTGTESGLLAVIGLTVAGLGAMVVSFARRYGSV